MSLSYLWLLAVIIASWSGWLIAGRTEMATLLMGMAMIVLSGLELMATKTDKALSTMAACGLVMGAGILCAGVFDRLDINLVNPAADWITGFLFGTLVVGVPLFKLNRFDVQARNRFSVGDIPLPHWDAIWISLGFGFWLLISEEVSHWFSMQGTEAPEWARILGCTLTWIVVISAVQAVRFGRIQKARLLLAACCPSILFLIDHAKSDWLSIGGALIVFWAICCAGGGYPLRWPSGTFDDGWAQLRNWLVTGIITLFMTTNISGSLTNRTVTDIMESHGRFAPLTDEAFMRLVMNDAYLWHGQIPSGADAGKSRPLIKGMRVAEKDRFSVAWTNDSMAGQQPRKGNPGVFLSHRDGQTLVAHVIPGSPADRAGVIRGWRLLPTSRGDSENKKSAIFTFTAPDDVRHEVSEVLEREPLVDFRIESGSGRHIGYLYLSRFDPRAKAQLDKAFAEFNRVKIEELVIDLRYNPGGAVFVVNHLAGLIAGNQYAGEVLYRISNNTKYADANYSGRFEFNPDRLDVKRVFVLTSEHTCSASELLVVSLQAYMPVITIGEVTCGKPFGSRPVRFGNQTFRVLSFRVSNARGNGFYNDGLVPQCFKADDLKQNFRLGTENDPMFKIAQTYMKNGKCE